VQLETKEFIHDALRYAGRATDSSPPAALRPYPCNGDETPNNTRANSDSNSNDDNH
jgi:hypothetical protein